MDSPIPPEQFQSSNRVLMIRPSRFGYHSQAAASNAFMNKPGENAEWVASKAQHEFDLLAEAVAQCGVQVLVYQDTDNLPDCLFPNNWVSWHTPLEGEPVVITYPMCDELRRAERRGEVLDLIASGMGPVSHLDLSGLEENAEILEGTGSLVLDRIGGKAFACLSPRTTQGAMDAWCDETGYEPIVFEAVDLNSLPIYHTNVMLSVGTRIAVVCLDSIAEPEDRNRVLEELSGHDRHVIQISLEQMAGFCGNILELADQSGQPVYAMSTRAYEGFTEDQRTILRSAGRIAHAAIPTIEEIGGGSVRCMIAEAGRVKLS